MQTGSVLNKNTTTSKDLLKKLVINIRIFDYYTLPNSKKKTNKQNNNNNNSKNNNKQ